MSRLAIHIGGGEARDLLARLHPANEERFTLERPDLSVAATVPVLRDGENVLIVDGTPLPWPAGVPADWRAAARELRAHDGVFNLVFWDAAAGKLVICTDFLGLQPLYWSRDPHGLRLCSETKAFQGEPDLAAWGAYLALGNTLGDRTLTAGVERLPAASVIVVDVRTRQVETDRYWSLDTLGPPPGVDEVFEALDDSMDKAIAAARGEQVLLMSGGFDARLIACLLKRKGQDFRALTVSHYDVNLDVDGRYACTFSRKLGVECTHAVPDHDFFSSQAYLDYLFASDAEIPSLYLFISQVAQFVPEGTTVWDGLIPGNTLKHPGGRPGGFDAYFVNIMSGWESRVWQAARRLFGEALAREMWDGFQQSVAVERASHPDDESGVARFVLRSRCRNRTAPNPFKVFQRRAQPLSPGMTRSYVERAMAIPYKRKAEFKFYIDLYRQHLPEALSLPVSHGGDIVRPRWSSLDYYSWRVAIDAHNFLQKRPRLMAKLGFDRQRYQFERSRYLQASALVQDDDRFLGGDLLPVLHQGGTASAEELRLLFHWRVNRWLHDGTLLDRLAPSTAEQSRPAA